MDSFLGMGTHVWLVIIDKNGVKTTFSGSKVGKLLGVIKNFKKDYNKPPSRGQMIIPPPSDMGQEEWDKAIIDAGDTIHNLMHKKLRYSGFFPCGETRGNCGTAAKWIVDLAGGVIPPAIKFKGFTPGLVIDC